MIGIITAITCGVLALLGGILSYVQAQSKASAHFWQYKRLIADNSGNYAAKRAIGGANFGNGNNLVLVIVFAIRLAKTRKFMPAGLMSLLGLVSLGLMVSELL